MPSSLDSSGTLEIVAQPHGNFFYTTVSYGAATTNSIVVSAPGSTSKIYLTDFIAQSDTSGTMNFLNDNTTTGLMFTLRFPASGGNIMKEFATPVPLTAGEPFGLTTSATVTSLFIAGYIAS